MKVSVDNDLSMFNDELLRNWLKLLSRAKRDSLLQLTVLATPQVIYVQIQNLWSKIIHYSS